MNTLRNESGKLGLDVFGCRHTVSSLRGSAKEQTELKSLSPASTADQGIQQGVEACSKDPGANGKSPSALHGQLAEAANNWCAPSAANNEHEHLHLHLAEDAAGEKPV